MKFNKFFWILSIMFLLVFSFVSAVGVAPNSGNVIAYWNFEDSGTTLNDLTTNGNDVTLYNTPTMQQSGIFDYSSLFSESSDQYGIFPDLAVSNSISFNTWVYVSDFSCDGGRNLQFIVDNSDIGVANYFSVAYVCDGATGGYAGLDREVFVRLNTGSGYYPFSGYDLVPNTWTMISVTYDGSNIKIYQDADLKKTLPATGDIVSNTFDWGLGVAMDQSVAYSVNYDFFDGKLDETLISTQVFGQDEIDYLYNSGNPSSAQQYPFTSTSVLPFSITAKDFWDDSSINSFWAFIDGTNYTTTNGTINTLIYQNDTSTYNVQVGASDYFTESYSGVDVSSNFGVVLHQSEISFASYEYISNNSISTCNYTIGGQQNSTFYLSEADDYVVLVECPFYYAVNHTFNVTAKDIKTVNVTGLYNSILNINLSDVVTSDLIETTSYVTVNNNVGFEQTFSNSNGSLTMNLTQNNYSLTLWADNYAFRSVNVTLDGTVETFTYSLYSNNSLWVTALDQNTGGSLNNFTVEVFDANNSYYSTDNNTGTIRLNNITSGVYTVRVDKEGYSVAEYALTMTGGSHQSLVAYLVASGSTTIFTVVDSISGGIIEGASASMYKTINSTWTLVSAQDTDITGRVQYTFISNIQYKFVIDADGYEQRGFFLKPLFSTYTIRLTPDVSSVPDENTGSYVYAVNNSGLFYDDQNNSVEISIYSGTGTIEYYYLNVTNYDDSVSVFTCLTANGCSDSLTLEITDALFNDSVIVEYWIKESGRSGKYFKNVYYVQDIYNPSTLEGWKDVDDGDVTI